MNSQILPLDMCLSFKRAIKESPILWMKPSYKFLEKAGPCIKPVATANEAAMNPVMKEVSWCSPLKFIRV